jgi:hypothetical protein
MIVRVDAPGGGFACDGLQGNWFCPLDGPPRRVPKAQWEYNERARVWSRSQPSWLEAWEDSGDARDMLRAAASYGVDARLVVSAACACARHVLPLATGSAHVRAVEACEAWVRGDGFPENFCEIVEAASEASGVAFRDQPRSATHYALQSAAQASWALLSRSSDAHIREIGDDFPHSAAASAAAAAEAAFARDGRASARGEALRLLANLVRREIPTDEVLRAVTRGQES